VSWFGQVPSHWSVKRVRYIGTLKGGAGFPHEQQGRKEGELPFFKVKDLGDVAMPLVSTDNYVSRETAADLRASVFPERTIVFAKVGAALLLNRFRILGTPGCIDNNMMGLTVDERVMTVPFALSVLALIDFKIVANPGAVPSVNEDQVSNFSLPVPPLNEQLAISDFLDRETTRLDALVTAKQRVLDLLAEKRKAIIATAVTRGLDPKVNLRDPGVPWLGEIPEHWSLVPLRYLLNLGPKNGISPQQSGADGVLSFAISAVRDGRVTIEGNEKLVGLDRSVARNYYLKSGDILLVRGNGNLSLVGTCGLLETAPDECTYPDILMLMRVSERVLAELLVAAINSVYVRRQIESLTQTTNGTYKLSGEDVRTLQIALPPEQEQRAIVEHIARETSKLDAVRAATERTIALLKERRFALIAAAVTGQLNVGAA